MSVFSGYARYYDIIYKDKDYASECERVLALINNCCDGTIEGILELGCGTAGHGLYLAKKGYRVTGVDISANMLEVARHKKDMAQADNLTLLQGDIRGLDLRERFDAVISMFAVIGYQNTNEDIMGLLRSVNRHLKAGGSFIFDCWYGPAVLNIKPNDRIARFDNAEGFKVFRYAKPSMEYNSNTVRVEYHLIAMKDGLLIDEVNETHRVRYFFIPELEFMLKQAGLRPLGFYDFNDILKPPSQDTWNMLCITIKEQD